VGITVCASSKVSKVYAIEPNMVNFALLQSNLQQNNCVNVITLNMSVLLMKPAKKISYSEVRYVPLLLAYSFIWNVHMYQKGGR
jgi:FkbM family methyltransferase